MVDECVINISQWTTDEGEMCEISPGWNARHVHIYEPNSHFLFMILCEWIFPLAARYVSGILYSWNRERNILLSFSRAFSVTTERASVSRENTIGVNIKKNVVSCSISN